MEYVKVCPHASQQECSFTCLCTTSLQAWKHRRCRLLCKYQHQQGAGQVDAGAVNGMSHDGTLHSVELALLLPHVNNMQHQSGPQSRLARVTALTPRPMTITKALAI